MTKPKLLLPLDDGLYECPDCRLLVSGTTGYSICCDAPLLPADCYESDPLPTLKTKLADIGTALEAVQQSLKDIQTHLEKQ